MLVQVWGLVMPLWMRLHLLLHLLLQLLLQLLLLLLRMLTAMVEDGWGNSTVRDLAKNRRWRSSRLPPLLSPHWLLHLPHEVPQSGCSSE